MVDYYTEMALANPKDVATLPNNRILFKVLGDLDLAYLYNRCSHISASYKDICGHCNKKYQ